MSDSNPPSEPTDPNTPEGSSGEVAPPPPPPPSDPYAGAGGGGDYGAPPPANPYGAQPPAPASGEQPGGLGDRFLARLIDAVLLFVVTAIIDLILLAGVLGLSAGSGLGMGGSYGYAAATAVITTAINLGYFGYLESSRGQTLGKMALKLRVQTAAGGNPTLEQAVKRNIWLALPIVGLVPILGGIVAGLGELIAVIMIAVGISNDSITRRPWTDKYAETRVLKIG